MCVGLCSHGAVSVGVSGSLSQSNTIFTHCTILPFKLVIVQGSVQFSCVAPGKFSNVMLENSKCFNRCEYCNIEINC